MADAEAKNDATQGKTWCAEHLGIACLLDEYPEYRHRCLAQRNRPCEFGEILDTIERLPLDVRLDLLRKLSELQRERLKREFGG